MYTIHDEIACLRRELLLRRRVYPRWVEQGKLSSDQAAREIELMALALRRVEALARDSAQGELFGMRSNVRFRRQKKGWQYHD